MTCGGRIGMGMTMAITTVGATGTTGVGQPMVGGVGATMVAPMIGAGALAMMGVKCGTTMTTSALC